ncbi:glycosyltransferase [Fusobacterium sp.]|uniref:glycosyltransferase n=1 Tax=Fusobacterium sp. TaxID=68766 RepID=UPI0026315C11|nr:glycosyltransferase [Fusobacterium sp.]
MKISVIISVYNKLEQLKNILLALNEQIELPFEVIIADDGSQEVLKEKIGDIVPKLKYTLKHIYQEDKGFRLAASRNNGLNYAEGDYILFIDQDILFDEYFLKNIRENIKKGEVLKINALFLDENRSKNITKKINENNNFDYKYIKSELTKEDYKQIETLNKKDKRRNFFFKLHLKKRGAKIVGLGIGCFKEDILKINGFDEKYEGWGCEDDDLGNRFYALGLGVRVFDFNNLVVHIWHPSSTNKSGNDEYYRARKKVILSKKEYKCEFGCLSRLKDERIRKEVIIKI